MLNILSLPMRVERILQQKQCDARLHILYGININIPNVHFIK